MLLPNWMRKTLAPSKKNKIKIPFLPDPNLEETDYENVHNSDGSVYCKSFSPSDSTPDVPPIVVDFEEEIISASEWPFEVDLQELVVINPNSDYSVTGIQEYSTSATSDGAWSEELANIEGDTLTYTPTGTYLKNALVLTVEVFDEYHPPTSQAEETSSVYGKETEDIPTEGAGEGEEGEVVVYIENNIIGDPNLATMFWANQNLNGGTCVMGATGGVMGSLMIEDEDGNDVDYAQVLNDFTQLVDPNRNVIRDPSRTSDSGAPLYRGIITGNILFSVPYYIGLTDIERSQIERGDNWWGDASDEIKSAVLDFIEDPDNLVGNVTNVYPTGRDWSSRSGPDYSDVDVESVNIYEEILNEYGVEIRHEYAFDFVNLVLELEAGNKVIATVDSVELWNSELLSSTVTTAQERADLEIAGLNSRENHAIWITGIDTSDPDDVRIIINDTAQGAGDDYSLRDFLAAWEDAEFAYMATGERPFDAYNRDSEQRFLRSTIRPYIGIIYSEGLVTIQESLSLHFADLFTMPDDEHFTTLITRVEQDHPGIADRYQTFLESEVVDRNAILVNYGIDPDEVRQIQTDVNVE